MGLLVNASVAIDGSKFKAVNNRDRNFTRAKVERRRAQLEQSVARRGNSDPLHPPDPLEPPASPFLCRSAPSNSEQSSAVVFGGFADHLGRVISATRPGSGLLGGLWERLL